MYCTVSTIQVLASCVLRRRAGDQEAEGEGHSQEEEQHGGGSPQVTCLVEQ
jgi:hypothetical protein